MTSDHTRRLNNLFKQVSPCFGCLREDLVWARPVPPLDEYRADKLRFNTFLTEVYSLGGHDPRPVPSEEQIRQDYAMDQDARRHAQEALRTATRMVPTSCRRESCRECERLRSCRELAERLRANALDDDDEV